MRSFPGKGIAQRAVRRAGRFASRAAAPFQRCDVAIFHEFAPPPSGGGHQFLRALKREWERRGLRVEVNSVSGTTRACLLNSYNFDADRYRFLRHEGCRTLHRVDGPLSVYRGVDTGADRKIAEWNREFAQGTIFQSRFSLEAHAELGLTFCDPVVIPNAADPEIFFPPGRPSNPRGRKLRVISASWSDNRNKGAETYEWLDRNLDFGRVEYVFVGRLPSALKNIRVVDPVPSRELAELLRGHDVYLTASRNDPCSNSLIEALSCGLPAIFLNSGGHSEITGEAGLGFEKAEDIPALMDQMEKGIEEFRRKICSTRIEDVADQYLEVMGLPKKDSHE
ncbi:MAG: glycosyltransferase family 4 protein [Kiritimatiellia bacterium]